MPYFTPALADALEATLTRQELPRWGVIDQDLAGTAAGSWFLSGTLGYSGRTVEDFRTATEALSGGALAGKDTYAWS